MSYKEWASKYYATRKENILSYKEWASKHYATPADAFRGLSRSDLQTQLRAARHSLRKWRGLREDVMVEHELRFSPHGSRMLTYREETRLYIDASSCALCKLCTGEDETVQCSQCPITRAADRTCAHEYAAFSRSGDVEPMIALLEKTVRYLERQIEAEKNKPQVGHFNVDALRWSYHAQPDGTYRISTAPSGEVWDKATPPGAVVADNVQNVDDAALMAFAPRLLSLLCKASAALATGEDSKELQKTIADALIGFANGRV